MRRPAGLDACPGNIERSGQGWEGRRVEDEPRPGAAGHLQPVPEQPEPGDIGCAGDPVRTRISPAARFRTRIWSIAAAMSSADALPWRLPLTSSPVPRRFVRISVVAGPGAALAQQLVGVGRADDREAVLRLGIADGVAAGERSAGFADLRCGAVEDRRERVPRQLLGERRDRQGEEDAAAHREHVAQRVRGRDLAECPGVVDERRKEVERGDDRELVGRSGTRPRRRPGETRDQLVRRRLGAESGKRVRQQIRAELGGAAAAVGQLGELDRRQRASSVVIGRS